MVGDQALFAAGIVCLVILAIALTRFGPGTGGRQWALAWACLYLAGLGAAVAGRWAVLEAFYPMVGTAFAAFLYLGARHFAGRSAPSWLLPVTLALAAARAIAQPSVSEALQQMTGAVIIAAASLGALAEVWPELRRRPMSASEWALAASFPLIGAVALTYGSAHVAGEHVGTAKFFYLITAALCAGTQTITLQSREARTVDAERAILAALIDAVPLGLALSNREGRIATMNRGFAKHLGGEERHYWLERPMEKVAERLSLGLEPTGRGAEPWESGFGSELRMADGRILVGHTRPVESQTGEPIGDLWFLNDVTEERGVHARLERARRLEMIADLAGGIAHDFNNQLTTVIGNAALIRESQAPDSSWEGPLSDLEEAAIHCADLTRDLLDFSHRGHRAPQPIDLADRIGGLAPRLRAQLPEDKHLLVEIEPTTPELRADPRQLDRALRSLVLNSREALIGRGTIRIEARGLASGDVEIVVADDGVGMTSATRERAIDPFFSTKGLGRGAGLGLAIVHGIVSGHGGELTIESAPGRGTRVAMRWPVASYTSADGSNDGLAAHLSRDPAAEDG